MRACGSRRGERVGGHGSRAAGAAREDAPAGGPGPGRAAPRGSNRRPPASRRADERCGPARRRASAAGADQGSAHPLLFKESRKNRHHPLPPARHRLRPRTRRLAQVSRSIARSWSSPQPRLVPSRGVGPVRRDDDSRRLLSGGDAPDDMNRSIRSIRSIPLQGQTAAPFRIVRIVLNHEGPSRLRRRHRETRTASAANVSSLPPTKRPLQRLPSPDDHARTVTDSTTSGIVRVGEAAMACRCRRSGPPHPCRTSPSTRRYASCPTAGHSSGTPRARSRGRQPEPLPAGI